MASKYPLKVRRVVREVHGDQITIDVHNITPTGTTVPTQLPAGVYAAQISVWATALDQPAVIKIQPYADDAQTLVDGSYKFLAIGAATATTNITIEANTATAKGYVRVLIPSGDQYGAAAPVMTVFGSQYTVTTTATTGIIKIALTAVEL